MNGFLPPGIAYAISDGDGFRVVTVAQARENRKVRQRLILTRRREPGRLPEAFKVWVGYFDQWLMGGWQAFLTNRRGEAWVDRDRKFLKGALMKAFPVCLPFGEDGQLWDDWKPAFAARYQRRQQDGKPLGVAFAWLLPSGRFQTARLP
jgi:hypothetical protein